MDNNPGVHTLLMALLEGPRYRVHPFRISAMSAAEEHYPPLPASQRENSFPSSSTSSTVMINASEDGDNTSSGTDSVAIYTPTSSETYGRGRSTTGTGSVDQELFEEETDPLLISESHPFGIPHPTGGSMEDKNDHTNDIKSSLFNEKGPNTEGQPWDRSCGEDELPTTRKRCCVGRRRCREKQRGRWSKCRRAWIFLKITTVLIGLAFFIHSKIRGRKVW
jgi:hypothetical protein